MPSNRTYSLPKPLRLIIKLAISIVALVLAFRDIDGSELTRVGLATNWFLMFAAVLLSIASVAALSLRWKQILKPVTSCRVSTLLRGHYIGFFGNNAFPLRAGEFMRADFIRRKLDHPFLSIFGTIFLERAIDLVIVGILFVGLTLTIPVPGVSSTYRLVLIGALVLVIVIVAVLARFRVSLARLLARRLPGATASRKLLGDLLTYRGLSALFVTSLLVWVLYSLRFQAVVSSIGLPIDPGLVILLLVATAAGLMIPAAPGALGTYHVAVVFSMHDIYGVQLTQAQAAAILLHLSAYVPSTLIGFVVFLSSGQDGEQT